MYDEQRTAEDDANASGNNCAYYSYIDFHFKVTPSILKEYSILFDKTFCSSITPFGTLDLSACN